MMSLVATAVVDAARSDISMHMLYSRFCSESPRSRYGMARYGTVW